MKTIYAKNIRSIERASRLIIAALMVGIVKMFPETVPAWIALLAAYPFATGLLSWDPLYVVQGRISKGMRNIKLSTPRRVTVK